MQELLSACREASEWLFEGGEEFSSRRLLSKRFPAFQRIEEGLHACVQVHAPSATPAAPPSRPLKAIAWNIERGKHFHSLLSALKNHPDLRDADLYFFTEVDWGMARTGNRNVAGDLGRELGLHAYFVPSYYNLTLGHGAERRVKGQNEYGLHGKAILSRYPLENLRAVALPNLTDKFHSKEARLGQKRALLADLPWKGRRLTLVCAHLDAFSSPVTRERQLSPVLEACAELDPVLMAGDWNTNTLDTASGGGLFFSVLRQLISPGPQRMLREHYPSPERLFERPLFQRLRESGFDHESCNERGVGTFDLFAHDEDLGQMGRDRFPGWILKWINRRVEKSGGLVSLKLDWFAVKSLRCLERKVLRLKKGEDYPPHDRPSDHHPVLLKFDSQETHQK
jgi:endonuclease/exonuclease/phosphatase family metal-dependent hydrolase